MPSAEQPTGVPHIEIGHRHGEQIACGVNVVEELDPIVTCQVPPRPGVLGKLL